jgi:zinc protease
MASPLSRGLSTPVREVLPNGLRLIVQEHHGADVVALQLWVGVGGRDEAPTERGFSHFAEHMLFKGTEARPRGFVDRDVEAIGGRTNAGTSYDYTFYYILLPRSRALSAIEVLADIAFNSRFDPEELAREREVVFEEMRLGEDNPRSSLVRRLYDLVFQGSHYGSPVLGDPTALRAATHATLCDYYKRHYVPDNMALVVVGPVDPVEVRRAAERSFGTVPRAGYSRHVPPPPPPIEGVRSLVVERPERQASLALGWLAPPLGHSDMYAVDVLAHILGGARSSRLNQALRERARLVSSVEASYGTLQTAGVVMVTAQLEAKDLDRAGAAILEEIRKLQTEGVTDAELERALTAIEAEHVFSRETAEGLARAYGRAEILWSLEEERRYMERVRRLTRDEVREAARRYLAGGYTRLTFVPKERVR